MNHRKRLSALLFAMLLAFLFLSFQKGRVKINALNFADEYFQEENVFLTANQIVPNETGIKDYRRGILVTATKSGGKLDLVDEISGHFEIDLMPYSRLTYSGSEYETASYVNPYQDLNTLSLVFTDAETGKTFKVVITGGAPGNSVTANAHVEAEGKKMGIYYHRDSEALGITAGANSRDVFTFLWGTSFSNMAVRGADYASKNVRSVKIEFDPVTMRVYGHSYGYNTDAEGRKLIWDFSKPENDGFDAGFSLDGFERYNVSLVFENVAAGRQANLLIYEINGQSFENSYLYNSSGPNLYAKPAAGKVNKKYPLPKPLAYDVLEGNLDFDGEVAVYDEKGYKVNVYDSQDRLLSGKFSEGAYFLPEKSGNYRVVYRGYDSEKLPGKELECIVKVVDENVPELVHDLNESHFVKNSPVTLPAGKVLYKGQEYPTTVSVFDPDNQVVASSGGKVNLTKAGRYVFRFQANLPDRGFEDEVEVFVSNPAEGIIQNLSSDHIEFGKADLNSALSGLIVTSSLNNSAIRLKDPLDFTKLNKNDLLVDLLVLPSKWGSSDFDQISIKLTDADDPGNYVLIVFSASDKEIDTTYIRAGAHNQKLAGRTKDGKIATAAGSGTPTLHSFSGQARYLNISEQSLRVYFDYPERKIFTSDNKLVADLDDSEFFVEPWNGFKNGKAYLEIQVSGLNSDKAVYLIKNIGGLNLENKIYLDATAPELEYDESLFVDGLKGRKYPLPEVTAYDKIEGVLPVSVEVRFEGGMVEVSAGGFLPLASGSYLITYTATDAFGNTAVFVKEIEVHDELPPIEVEIEGALGRGHVGTEIAVPGFSARGGAGKLEVSVKAIGLNTGTEYAVVGLRFTPLVADVYKIVYTATDRLGSVSEEFIQVEVIVSERPIIAAPAFIPHIIIDGLETRFSVTTAIDYNQTPAKAVAVEMKLVLEGKEITISDGKHLPQLTQMNSVARLVYRATSPVTGKEAVLEYEIPAIRLYDSYGRLQLAQYFLSEGIDAIEPSRNYIDFTTQTSGAKLTFIKEVAADGFQIVFNVPATANNVDSIIIRMKDAQDPAKTVKFTVRKANSQDAFSYLTINDSSTTTMAGTFFGTTAARLNLYYNNTLFSVSDDNGLPIAYIKTFEDGSPFTGFSSTVNFEIIFENVTGIATLRLQQVGNQLISSVDDDYTVPSISIFGEMVRSAKLNEHVTIPDATAFDVLSFSTSISIRITDPDNQVIYSSNNGKGTKIVVGKYGTYYVTYTATDGNGNPMTMTRAISVLDDVAPEIVLKGKIPTSGKLGSTLKLPEFEVSDNYTENVDTRIFVIDPENVMSVVVNGNVTFAKEGKYTIRYFAIDEAGNMNYLDYVVEVR